MPATVVLRLRPRAPLLQPPQLHWLHGFACKLTGEKPEVHRDQRKPWRLHQLRLDGGDLLMPVVVLDDRSSAPEPGVLEGRLLAQEGQRKHLGWTPEGRRVEVDVVSARVRDRVAYADLPTHGPARSAKVDFLTPTCFDGDVDYPLPDPYRLIRVLARRWTDVAPDLAPEEAQVRSLVPRVAVSDAGISVARVDVAVDDEGRPIRHNAFLGFARFVVHKGTPTDEALFARLLESANWLGVGAQTTHGLGAVSVQMGGPSCPRPAAGADPETW